MVLNQIAKIGTKTIKYALTIYANVVLKRPVFFSLSHSIILYMLLSHPLICSILTIMNANKTQIKQLTKGMFHSYLMTSCGICSNISLNMTEISTFCSYTKGLQIRFHAVISRNGNGIPSVQRKKKEIAHVVSHRVLIVFLCRRYKWAF